MNRETTGGHTREMFTFACTDGPSRPFELETSGLARHILKDIGEHQDGRQIPVPFGADVANAARSALDALVESDDPAKVSAEVLEFLRFIQCRVDFIESQGICRMATSFVKCPSMLARACLCGYLLTAETYRAAAARGSLEALKFIAGRIAVPPNICGFASKLSHIEFLHEEIGAPVNRDTLETSVGLGHVHCIRYQLDHGVPVEWGHRDLAIKLDRLECFRELGGERDAHSLIIAAKFGARRVLEYILQQPPMLSTTEENVILCTTDRECFRMFRETYRIWGESTAIRNDWPEFIESADDEALETAIDHDAHDCLRAILRTMRARECHVLRAASRDLETFRIVSASFGWTGYLVLTLINKLPDGRCEQLLAILIERGLRVSPAMIDCAAAIGHTRCERLLLKTVWSRDA